MAIESIVFIAASLDGYIARRDGGLDWLDEANQRVPEGEECGFFSLMASVDALVMGRKTFEKILSFDQWVYGDTPVIVLTHKTIALSANFTGHVSFACKPVAELVTDLENRGMRRVYVDGACTIQNFLKAGLISEITITTIPIILGQGIPLFSQGLVKDITLTHIKTKAYDFGFVQSTYQVNNRT